MIEIQVDRLVKSFEVGKNVLDGLTFQVDQGERVGLLGKNGAGKTTLFKILTGELDYDEGEVHIGQGRRIGLISQIPVYPAGYTVEDVLRTAFSRVQALAEEMESSVLSQPGVLGVDALNTRLFGDRIYVDVEIRANGELTLNETHATAQAVHDALEAGFPQVKHCMVHVNPARVES